MKMKLKDIMLLNQILKNIIDQDTDRKIQALFKFKILGILKNMESPIANFEVIRNEKIREYGTEREDGTISIPEDNEKNIKQFTEDLNSLMESEVEISIEKLKAEDVFNAGVPADFLVGLYGIIEE